MAVRKILSLPEDLAKRIDDYRFEQRLKTEADAMRELLEAGLTVKPKKR